MFKHLRAAGLMLGALVLAMSVTATRPALAVPVTDFVFMIDATASMGGEIAGVKAGFSSFVAGLNAANVDSRFAIVAFGGEPELILDFTADQTLAAARLNQVAIGAVAGVQNNHNFNPEASLETIRMVLGAATVNELANNNTPEDGILNFRGNARKNLILATDEDGDRPFHAANRLASQTTVDPPTTMPTDWQTQVYNTANAVINAQAYFNMLVNRNEAPSRNQYGDPNHDVSDANFLNFNAAATLANLLADTVTDQSLQAQVLNAGLVARTFNVAGANDPNFVDNFFAAKVQEVQQDPGVIPRPSRPNGVIGDGRSGYRACVARDGDGMKRRKQRRWRHRSCARQERRVFYMVLTLIALLGVGGFMTTAQRRRASPRAVRAFFGTRLARSGQMSAAMQRRRDRRRCRPRSVGLGPGGRLPLLSLAAPRQHAGRHAVPLRTRCMPTPPTSATISNERRRLAWS